MEATYYSLFTNSVSQALKALIVSDAKQKELSAEDGLNEWCKITKKVQNYKSQMLFVGNGASAAMAAHMSADAFKNANINAKCLNESSLMTAIGNDIEFRQVFSYPIEKFSEPNDVLVTISSSGNSPNIIAAIEAAKDKNMKVITLSGMKQDNQSRRLGDFNFYIPANSYGVVESCHQVLLHCWLDKFMDLPPN